MPSSFLVGAQKIASNSEPRLVILAGDTAELRALLAKHMFAQNYEVHCVDGSDFTERNAFTPAYRQSKEKLLYVTNGQAITNFEWLPRWFNKVKRVKLLLETDDRDTAVAIETKARSRGLLIDCSAPTGASGQLKFIRLLSRLYKQPHSQLTLLLNKNDWQLTPCMQLLEKLAVLNLPLTSDTIAELGIVFSASSEFLLALKNDNPAQAMSLAPRVPTDELISIIHELSQWLDKLSRIKFAQVYMKAAHTLANELALPTKELTELQKQARRFETERLNKLGFLLAEADRDLHKGFNDGVLEVMVARWS